jgi:hypothetical protein
MVHTQLYSESFPENINDLRSPSNYPFVGMLYDDSSLLYSYESIIKQNDNEILYKAPLVQDGEITGNSDFSSINIDVPGITLTGDDYNILPFNYTSSDKIMSGWYEASIGGIECYCLKCNGITELVLPNGVEEIDAMAFKCPNLTTVTLPSSIKRFRSVTYTDIYSADLETVTHTLIFGSKIETIYFDGTMNEWKAIDKNTNWIPIGKIVRVICHDYFLRVKNNISSVDIEAQPKEPGGSIEK